MITIARSPLPRVELVLFVRKFLDDYRRNPINLLILVLIPVVFVVVAAGPMADAAKILGGSGIPVQNTTVGWAAGFIAAIAMYFQTRMARAADRRLVLAGLRAGLLVAARLLTGLALAVLASTAAVLALIARSGVDHPVRLISGAAMFAVIYLAIGALTGALVRNPVNGTVVILFVWIIDVFFGPAMGSADRMSTRWLPTHFVTLWMVDVPSGHSGRIGDLGWALVWTLGAVAVSAAIVTTTTRVAHVANGRRRVTGFDQFATGLRMGLRDYRRNPVLWALLLIVPLVFIWLAKIQTPNRYSAIVVHENGHPVSKMFWLPNVHAGTMTPIAIASLATLAGLFIALDARTGDERLALSGFRFPALLFARLGVIAAAVLLTTAGSMVVTAAVFHAHQWSLYIAANLLLAATYALLGVCLGPIFGRVGGVLIAFLVPFLDLGMGQSPMLHTQPPTWAHALPGYGSFQTLLAGGLTDQFTQTGALLVGLAWFAGLGALAAWLFHRAEPASGG